MNRFLMLFASLFLASNGFIVCSQAGVQGGNIKTVAQFLGNEIQLGSGTLKFVLGSGGPHQSSPFEFRVLNTHPSGAPALLSSNTAAWFGFDSLNCDRAESDFFQSLCGEFDVNSTFDNFVHVVKKHYNKSSQSQAEDIAKAVLHRDGYSGRELIGAAYQRQQLQPAVAPKAIRNQKNPAFLVPLGIGLQRGLVPAGLAFAVDELVQRSKKSGTITCSQDVAGGAVTVAFGGGLWYVNRGEKNIGNIAATTLCGLVELAVFNHMFGDQTVKKLWDKWNAAETNDDQSGRLPASSEESKVSSLSIN